MKLCQISALAVALNQASLVVARAAAPQDLDVESADAIQIGSLSQLFDSLVWLDDDDGGDDHAATLRPGDKIPGHNFLKLCGGDHSNDAFQFINVDLDPGDPVTGKPLKISGTGRIDRWIEEGTTARVEVSVGRGLPIYKHRFNLCEELGKVGTNCPMQPGKPKLSKSFNIPKSIPKGHYNINVQVTGADNKPVTCVEGAFKIVHSA